MKYYIVRSDNIEFGIQECDGEIKNGFFYGNSGYYAKESECSLTFDRAKEEAEKVRIRKIKNLLNKKQKIEDEIEILKKLIF